MVETGVTLLRQTLGENRGNGQILPKKTYACQTKYSTSKKGRTMLQIMINQVGEEEVCFKESHGRMLVFQIGRDSTSCKLVADGDCGPITHAQLAEPGVAVLRSWKRACNRAYSPP